MNLQKLSIVALICALFSGCTATPPGSQIVSCHPVLDRDPGVMLLIDVCIQRDALGNKQDYFIVGESRDGAEALLKTLRKLLADSGVVVTKELIPFVCGARHDANRQVQNVADCIDGTAHKAFPPFDASNDLRFDLGYGNALERASTYMFEHALMPKANAKTVNGKLSKQPHQYLVSDEEFRAAVAIIAARTQASSLLYVGVAGTSISSGKAVAGAVGSVLVGVATGVGTASLDTGYSLIFIPGHQIAGRLMGATLIDLQAGQLVWSNAVRAGGNPAESKVVADMEAMTLLLRGLLFQSVPTPAN